MPAYVPTMSPFDRSMSSWALTVSSSSSTSSSGAETFSGVRLVRVVRRADDPVAGPRDDEHDAAGNSKRESALRREAVAPDHDVGAPARDEAVGPLERGESRFRVRRPDARRIDDPLRADLELVPAHEIADGRPDQPLAVEQRPLRLHPRRRDGAACERGSEHRERQPRVILDPVVVDDPAGQALAPQVRRVLDRARRPKVLREPAVPPRTEQVVQEDAAPVEALVEQRDAVDREEERLQGHEVRREPEQPRALLQRLVDQPEVELLQVAQPAVDQPGRPPGRPRGDVALLHERSAQSAARRVQQRARRRRSRRRR